MPASETTEETTAPAEETTEAVEPEVTEEPDDTQTFPASVVHALRKESAGYRTRATEAEARAETLAARLHAALVSATGLLVDDVHAGVLPYDATHLDDPEALTTAIAALVEKKPYLKSRKPSGSIGLGVKGGDDAPVSFASMFHQHA